jgi:hypothetical protein
MSTKDKAKILEALAYIRRQLEDGCAYVILPNDLAKRLV